MKIRVDFSRLVEKLAREKNKKVLPIQFRNKRTEAYLMRICYSEIRRAGYSGGTKDNLDYVIEIANRYYNPAKAIETLYQSIGAYWKRRLSGEDVGSLAKLSEQEEQELKRRIDREIARQNADQQGKKHIQKDMRLLNNTLQHRIEKYLLGINEYP